MRDLRSRLAQVAAATAPERPADALARRTAAPTDCFARETAVPLEEIPGLRELEPEGLRRIDGGFAGRCGRMPDPRRLLFLDTETTGLGMGAGTVAFLLGLGWIEDDAFVVRQYLMRDYPEEPLMLEAFAGLLPRFDAFVTYNGKSFDLPLLENRLTMHRMRQIDLGRPHLDLVHPSRRVWRMRLQDCTLGNIERRILDCGREDDLPGSEVPERYFAYLKTGEFVLLEDVLRHNLRDIQTLGKLLVRLAGVFAEPEQQDFLEDVFSVGRALARDGDRETARACFRAAGAGQPRQVAMAARTLLALSHRRDRQFTEAEGVYKEMIARGEGGVAPYVELAKIAEHQRRDPALALAHTEAALERLAFRERLGGEAGEEAAGLHLRRARLLRRMLACEKQGKNERGERYDGIHDQPEGE